jgi:hypothetical protein
MKFHNLIKQDIEDLSSELDKQHHEINSKINKLKKQFNEKV